MLIKNRKFIFTLLCCALIFFGCSDQDTKKKEGVDRAAIHITAAVKGLDSHGNMQVSGSDNCSICGMPVHKHLKFATGIELMDGTTFYFCGTQCMIRAWIQPEIYIGAGREQLKKSVLTSYFTGAHIDGETAVFVMGSDVMGPMGPGLVGLFGKKESVAFIQRHGGTAVYGISMVSQAVWEKANGRKLEK